MSDEPLPGRRDFLFRRTPEPADLDLLSLSRPAMGTRFEVLFPRELRRLSGEVHRALDEVRRLENILSYFQPSSETSRLNREASEGPVEVGPEMWELLQISSRLHRETGGAFDPACGALWRCWGFHRRGGRIPPTDELERARECSGFDHVELLEGRRVRFGRAGLELNFGSIGKGFALDRAAAILQNAGLATALLHSGNSSFQGLGNPGVGHRGWTVGIRHPVEMDRDCARVRLSGLGMGTSGISEQSFEVDGKKYGHILDPRTGWPKDRYASATVLARSAAEADALATACFNSELSEIRELAGRLELGVVVVPHLNAGALRRWGWAVELVQPTDG